MTPDVIAALLRIVDYGLADGKEERDWEEQGKPEEGHIYPDLVAMREWLEEAAVRQSYREASLAERFAEILEQELGEAIWNRGEHTEQWLNERAARFPREIARRLAEAEVERESYAEAGERRPRYEVTRRWVVRAPNPHDAALEARPGEHADIRVRQLLEEEGHELP